MARSETTTMRNAEHKRNLIIKNSKLLLALVILAITLALSACGNDPTPTSAPPAANPTATAAPQTTKPATPLTPTAVASLPTITANPTATKPASLSTATPLPAGPGKIVYDTPDGAIYLVNPDGSGKTKIGDGRSPIFSPDGKQIAYAALFEGQTIGTRPFKAGIQTVNLDGSNRQNLCEAKADYLINPLRWSPRNRYIAYNQVPSNSDGISTVSQCGTADKVASEVKRSQGTPLMIYDWSPDGNYAIWQNDKGQVFYGDPDKGGEGAVTLTNGEYAANFFGDVKFYTAARFSPDGKTIALAGEKLFFVSAPGQKSALAGKTLDIRDISSLAWSPNGQKLVISAFGPQGFGSLKVLDLSEKQFGQATPLAERSGRVDWSRQ